MRLAPLGLIACLTLAACGDPLGDVPRLADQDVVEAIGQAGVAGGPPPETIAETVPETVPGTVPETMPETGPEAGTARGGLFGFLRGRAQAATEGRAATEAVEEAPPEAAASAAPDPAPRRGLFGGGGADALSPDAPDYRQVGPGVTLPYGEVARLCGAPVDRLGREVLRHPERGRGWTLYDSQPGGTGQRSFWLTGFDDGCARQFTAALVLFGPVESYESIRYSPAGKTLPVSETDRAYEALKSRLCGVGRGRPCGDRIGRMGDAVFVSVYERFGSNPRWKDMLLHDGALVAVDVKTR